MRASIERIIRVGGNRWDVYLRLETPSRTYRVFIPLMPRQPDSVSAEAIDDKRTVIRLFSGGGGVCTCELDLGELEILRCRNISCSPGAVWVADEDLVRSHVTRGEDNTNT